MTVGELIPILEEMDPSTLVVIGVQNPGGEHFKPAADDVYGRAIVHGDEVYEVVVLETSPWPEAAR
jgi:hypothetical protein